MTPAQTQLYFREWGAVRKHYLARGIDAKLVDAKRHELHRKALGQGKSSKIFTNADLDKVLATFRAITAPSDLMAQILLIEQPELRLRALMAKARDLASGCVDRPGLEGVYLDGMARRIYRAAAYEKLTEEQLAGLCGVLQQRLDQIKRRNQKQPVGALRGVAAKAAAAEAEVPGNDDPF